MNKILEFESYTIEEVPMEKELNYIVKNKDGYVCRLVPGYAGFELSATDKAVDNDISPFTIAKLSEFLVEQHG